MSRTQVRPHTTWWKPKQNDRPIIQRVREHPRHTIKSRLRLSLSLHEMELMDTINP